MNYRCFIDTVGQQVRRVYADNGESWFTYPNSVAINGHSSTSIADITRIARELSHAEFLLECDGEPIAELLRAKLGLPVVKCWKRASALFSSYIRIGVDEFKVHTDSGVRPVKDFDPRHLCPCTLPELLAEYESHPEIVARIRELTLPVEAGDFLIISKPSLCVVERLRKVSAEFAEKYAKNAAEENEGELIELFPLGERIKAFRTRTVTEEVTE